MSLLLRKKVALLVLALALLVGGFLYLRSQVYYSVGKGNSPKQIEVATGQNALEAGKVLKSEKLLTNEYYFAYYLWRNGKLHALKAGKYEIKPGLTIPEVAKLLTEGEILSNRVKVTFPEGWASADMAKRLSNNNLPGEEFLALVKKPSNSILDKYAFFSDFPKGASLEGYLFPDTYYFSKDATAEQIVIKMLDNFDQKFSDVMRKNIKERNITTNQLLTMASILEGEVRSDQDRKVVSGIFWNRIKVGQALQSCATLAYVLGENKKQYSIADTQVKSPYNTYLNKGLPPGPISNPGVNAIEAAIYPQDSNYNYFLSDPATGKTVFSATFEEHVANKTKYGL